MNRVEQLSRVDVPDDWTSYRDSRSLKTYLDRLPDLAVASIGTSREGQPLHGYTLGTGPSAVSIVAGAHADEPVGPMTAQALPALMRAFAPHLLERFTFRVVPQINPDGADRNRAWFADTLDFSTYVKHAVRETPGDDIEFGFLEAPEARPECRAAIPFLWGAGPVDAHFSLHGMAWAEGAWFLINPPWAKRAAGLMDDLAALCQAHQWPLMELERNGEKGFRRIREGFSTTPNSVAMQDFFLQTGDPETAAKFLPSSMETAMAKGGDPLCIVTELPLFLLDVPASLEDPVLYRFRDALATAQSDGSDAAITEVAERFHLRALPLAQQVSVQFATIVLALDHLAAGRARLSR